MARVMKRPRCADLEVLDGGKLRLTFVNGVVMTLDFAPLCAESPGLAPLRDPAAFAGAVLDADTLWLDAQAQQAPDENTRDFAHWRARHGLSLTQAARALGLTARTISAYGTGARPVPRYIALACKGWEVERQGRESPHLTR